jgi:multiple antibiotic resistance protein
VVTMQSESSGGRKEKITAETPISQTLSLAFSPLTTPVIVTPYGVVAILFFMSIADGNTAFKGQIIGLIFLMMVLNYLGMIFAQPIMNTVGFPILRLIGWIFAVMQSALAIDVMLGAFKSLGLIQRIN